MILIDGHSLALRFYYALKKDEGGGLRSRDGVPTTVCHGVLSTIIKLINIYKPTHLAIAFDGGPTFRHKYYPNYKNGRKVKPDDFQIDLANLKEILRLIGIQSVAAPGYEADDILATMSTWASGTKIISADQDLYQLVDDITTIINPQWQEMGSKEIKAKLGIYPSQVVDYKALCGDTSDNIPGVKGIGRKTTVALLNTYGSLQGVYANLEFIKCKDKLIAGYQDAEMSRFLAKLVHDVPLGISLEDCNLQKMTLEKGAELMAELNLVKTWEGLRDFTKLSAAVI